MLFGELQSHIIAGETVQGILVKINHPKKSAIIRVPTGAEFDEVLQKYAKRSKNKIQQTDKKPTLELFNAVRADKAGEPFDEYEAEFIIDWLYAARIVSGETVADEFVVTLKTAFCDVVHYMSFPSFKQMKTISKPNVLYDALVVRSEGYAKDYDVPSIHKELVAIAIERDHSSMDPMEVTDPNELP